GAELRRGEKLSVRDEMVGNGPAHRSVGTASPVRILAAPKRGARPGTSGAACRPSGRGAQRLHVRISLPASRETAGRSSGGPGTDRFASSSQESNHHGRPGSTAGQGLVGAVGARRAASDPRHDDAQWQERLSGESRSGAGNRGKIKAGHG